MPAVNFYLKKAENPGETRLIYLQFKYSGQRLVYSFGQKVDGGKWSEAKQEYLGGNWNYDKQRVKSNKETTADGQHSLNDLLDNLRDVLIKAYNDEIKNGMPSPRKLREGLDNFIYKNLQEDKTKEHTLYKLIDRFIEGEIKFRGNDKSAASLNNYSSVKKHLQEFERKRGYKIDFETISLDFFYQYTSFLKKYKPLNSNTTGLSQNTIAKDITILKVFMGEAVDLGYTNNLQFKHKKFTVSSVDTDAVYLTEKEVTHIYQHDFSDNKKLEAVRDLFVVGCLTGLRYSDYSNILPENIINDGGQLFIKMITQKTKEQVIIPCSPVVLEIFQKYQQNSNRLPRALSNQKFNEYIKEVCRAAKLTVKGRLATDPSMELCQCISSHTARRSFATNLYLEGFPTIDLMKITGHKTEKAFMKYIRVSKLDTAKRLAEHIKMKWESKLFVVKNTA